MSLNLKTLKAKFINGKPYDLDCIIKTAYRDLQLRTIKGHDSSIQKKCIEYLKVKLNEILSAQPLSDKDFDTQHNVICEGFLSIINSFETIEEQNYGKAQKVVNIIFKFLVAYGKWQNEDQCHMPIDSFVLKWLYKKDTYKGKSWSNISHKEYEQIQKDIKEKIQSPITVGNKSGIAVKNRAEADYYVWYITKVERNYKDTKNSIKKLLKGIDIDDAECVSKKIADEILNELDKLKNNIKELKFK